MDKSTKKFIVNSMRNLTNNFPQKPTHFLNNFTECSLPNSPLEHIMKPHNNHLRSISKKLYHLY